MNAPLRTPHERLNHIIEQACLMWSVDRDELLGSSRVAVLTAPRAAVAFALRHFVPHAFSYPRIAEIMLREDHTTIMNLVARARDMRSSSTGFAKATDGLCAIARGDSW